MKIIAISGAKNSKKDLLAMRLAKNSDCIWIHPYTDRTVPVNETDDEYIHLNASQLDAKMQHEIPLVETIVNSHRYVFFETQFRADYCVLLADDRVIMYLKNNWDGDLITVKCESKNSRYSERSLLDDSEFEYIFNWDTDDYDDLEDAIVYR